MARLMRPSRLNGKGRSPSLHCPHSVAWISQWLAEPRTRVRIAVGPLYDTNRVDPRTFMQCPQVEVNLQGEFTLPRLEVQPFHLVLLLQMHLELVRLLGQRKSPYKPRTNMT